MDALEDVMQQQRATSDVSQVGEHADHSRRGRKDPQPRGNAYAAEAFAARDPLDRVDAAGNALTESMPVDPGVGGFGGAGATTPAAGPLVGKARVKATEARPLRVLRPSSEDQLVELLPAEAEAQDAVPVAKRYGSIEQPGSYEELEQDALFIGGRPHVEDVRQGGLGTCYLLADLVSVASADPAHIQGMISVQGGVATVLFHRFDEQAQKWVPAPVSVGTKLARDTRNPDALLGAGFRVSEEPVEAAWHAEVNLLSDGNELAIWRRSVHEAALWVPLVEKAYARFAEMYGQFGGHPEFRKDEKSGGSGYDATDGGWGAPVLWVLYGDGVTDRQLQWKGGRRDELATRHEELIASLVSLRPAGGTLATASLLSDKLPVRLFHCLRRALSASEIPPELLAVCHEAMVAADIARTTDAIASLVPFASALVDAVPAGVGGELGRARDVALVVTNVGATSAEERSVYADHSYAVLAASFRDHQGAPLALSTSNLTEQLPSIDVSLSTVTVHNPHGEGEVDRDGTGPEDGVDDGAFELTLERFVTLFSQLDIGQRP